jgi:ACS family tartrate transporter-like MFS transporter
MALLNESTGETLSEAEQKATVRKVAWRLIPILGLAYFINSIDKTNISIASLTMNDEIGLSAATFGLASGLFFIGYFVFEVPSNVILYKVGPRKWIARIMVSWGIVSACSALVGGATSLYIVRILLGVAEAGFYPGVLLYLMFWFPHRYRGRMLAYFVLGGALSSVIGSPLTGLIMTHADGLFGLSGWRSMFVLEGIPAVVVGIAALFVLRDQPSDAKWLPSRQKNWLNGVLAEERADVHAHNAKAGRFRMLADVRVMLLSFAYFCKCFGQYALTFFMPQMIVVFEASAGHKYSVLTVSLLTAIPAAMGVIASIPWAIHSDRTGERFWHSALPLFVATVGICVAAMLSEPILIMIALCVANIGINTQSSAFFQIPGRFLTGVAAAGGLAMVNAIGNLGGFAAPYATGWLKDMSGNFSSACYVMGAIMAIGGIATLAFPRVAAWKAQSETTSKVGVHV